MYENRIVLEPKFTGKKSGNLTEKTTQGGENSKAVILDKALLLTNKETFFELQSTILERNCTPQQVQVI